MVIWHINIVHNCARSGEIFIWKCKTLKPFFSFWQNVKFPTYGRNLMNLPFFGPLSVKGKWRMRISHLWIIRNFHLKPKVKFWAVCPLLLVHIIIYGHLVLGQDTQGSEATPMKRLWKAENYFIKKVLSHREHHSSRKKCPRQDSHLIKASYSV